jgi:hypothetical protein
MNLLSAAMRPVSFCTSFLICGGCIWRIALILLELTSIPLVETRQPNTLCRVTPKTHFSRLSLRLASHILAKLSIKSESTFLLTWSFNSAKCGACVARPLWHSHIAISAKWCYETGLFIIFPVVGVSWPQNNL